MRLSFWNVVAVLLIPALILCAAPVACSAGDFLQPEWGLNPDDSSDGAVITLGLFVTAVAVLFVLGLRSDIDNVFGHHQPLPALPAASSEALARRASLVLDTPMVNHGTGSVSEQMASAAPADSVGLGFRITF